MSEETEKFEKDKDTPEIKDDELDKVSGGSASWGSLERRERGVEPEDGGTGHPPP
jgi:hypothetical protein